MKYVFIITAIVIIITLFVQIESVMIGTSIMILFALIVWRVIDWSEKQYKH